MRAARDRRLLLFGAVLALVPATLATGALEKVHRDSREQLAVAWSDRGERDLNAGRAADAVADFRTARLYLPDDPAYRLRLAQALIAAGEPVQAEAHLLTLWAEEPGNGLINLELGRLAAGRSDLSAAVRYYHSAIDGSWERDAAEARRSARLELANVLLDHHDQLRAQAELIALIGDLPPDAAVATRVAGLLDRAGADARALAIADQALALDPANARASRLAGAIAFRQGDYRAAERYLAQAANAQPLDPDGQQILDVSVRVLRLDPYARGIGTRERARRAERAFVVARDRLMRCGASPHSNGRPGPPPPPPSAAAIAPPPAVLALTDRVNALDDRVRAPELARDADLFDEAMATVFDIEALDSPCALRTTDDRALQLIARGRPGSAR